MDNLHWELSVLSKSIHYKNLSGAALHVGLSQPQLSRIISRLEAELGVVLLDRTVRRKSGWTPVAYKIADTYFRNSRKLTQDLQQLKSGDQMTQLTIGLLEGLTSVATEFCRQLLEQAQLTLIELNVYDLSELEERFEKDELDLIFTCREPSKHKYSYVRALGYQVFEKRGTKAALKVFSQFEYANHIHSRKPAAAKKQPASKTADKTVSKTLLSNSLAIRKLLIEETGGMGFVPSEVRRKKSADDNTPVYLIGQDLIVPAVWKKFEQIQL